MLAYCDDIESDDRDTFRLGSCIDISYWHDCSRIIESSVYLFHSNCSPSSRPPQLKKTMLHSNEYTDGAKDLATFSQCTNLPFEWIPHAGPLSSSLVCATLKKFHSLRVFLFFFPINFYTGRRILENITNLPNISRIHASF